MSYPCELGDVFGQDDLTGNPLAVVHAADSLSAKEMQRIARWLNLSEAAFLLRPTVAGADYRVRIFALDHELPFAGHPTLGSCHAWLRAGGVPAAGRHVVQECGAGLVRIAREGVGLAFAAPPLIRSGPLDETMLANVATILNLPRDDIVDATWADNGPGWIAVMLASAQAVIDLAPARSCAARASIGVVGRRNDAAPRYEIRAFFTDPSLSLVEDPVCGSFNASVAQWLFASNRVSGSYTAFQGQCVGRDGRITLQQDADGQVWVGGRTATLSRGSLSDAWLRVERL